MSCRMMRCLWILIVVGLIGWGTDRVSAETLRFINADRAGGYHGVEDTTIKASQPEASFGGAPFLQVGSDEKALLRFGAASTSEKVEVESASLDLTLEKLDGDWQGVELVVYAVAPAAGGWNAGRANGAPENGATCWNELLYSEIKNVQTGLPMHTEMVGQKGFGRAGSDYLPQPLGRVKLSGMTMPVHITIPISNKAMVQGWLDKSASNSGLLLVAEGQRSGSVVRATFDSSESTREENRPALVLQIKKATPDSGSVSGSGVGRIHYELKKPGFISLAIYNEKGQVVRELLHGADQAAGMHDETWDGLDEAGQKVGEGRYSWKLLQTQGLKAEYLMTLGLSVDFYNLWPGNHIGVTGLAVDESGVYLGSGCAEAPGFVLKMTASGERLWTLNRYWYEEWQGPHSLAVDGKYVYLMQENYDVIRLASDKGTAGPIWDLVYDKTKPKDRPLSRRADGGWVQMKLGKGRETAAVDLAAGEGRLVMSYENFDCLRWIDPKWGKSLREVKVKEPLGVAIDKQGRALVVSEGQVLAFPFESDNPTLLIPAERLTSPWRLSVNRNTGEIWVAERGVSQQVKCFSPNGKLLKTFGKLGGRPEQGLYDGAIGFREINSIAAAPDGSFWISEAFTAPRRVAHFDADGKLIKEWYGPQMYANRASADPADPSLVWMDSMWGELIQAKVDYTKKTWSVRATYSYMNPLQPRYRHENGMWFVAHANGKTYLAKETEPNVMMVDEKERRLIPMVQLGVAYYPGGNAEWKIPKEFRPLEDPWPGQTAPAPTPIAPWNFIWTNTDGSDAVLPKDVKFGRELYAFSHHGFVRPDLTYVTSAMISWKDTDNVWQRKNGGTILKSTGFSAAGVPNYDWSQFGNIPLQVPDFMGPIRCVWEDANGDLFTAHNALKTRSGKGPFGVGKTAAGWGGNYVAKWGQDGTLKWVVGHHAAGAKAQPGEARSFYRMAGSVKGCIAVNDIDYSMVHVWDQDGLWVGRLMDNGLVNDSIPQSAYGLCGENFGGYLFENREDGAIYFLGGAANASAVYRITGWDQFERQQGAVEFK